MVFHCVSLTHMKYVLVSRMLKHKENNKDFAMMQK